MSVLHLDIVSKYYFVLLIWSFSYHVPEAVDPLCFRGIL